MSLSLRYSTKMFTHGIHGVDDVKVLITDKQKEHFKGSFNFKQEYVATVNFSF